MTAKNKFEQLLSSHAQLKLSRSETIEKFIKSWEHLPAQRSKEWKDNRKKIVGGSELKDFISQSVSSFVHKKHNNSFFGNIHTAFGTHFENDARRVIEYICETTVYELPGSIPHYESELSAFCYSGDGIAEMTIEKFLELVELEIICRKQEKADIVKYVKSLGKKTIIVLFEIKCPSKRVPDGTIPKQYIPQVKMGMDVITIADIVVFGDFMFRRCALTSIGTNFDYDSGVFHDKDGALKTDYTMPIACGVHSYRQKSTIPIEIELISADEKTEDKDYADFETKVDSYDPPIDLGMSDCTTLIKAFNNVFNNDVTTNEMREIGIVYTGFESNDSITAKLNMLYDLVDNELNNADCCGVLPWKLINMKLCCVLPDKKYLSSYAEKIKQFGLATKLRDQQSEQKQ